MKTPSLIVAQQRRLLSFLPHVRAQFNNLPGVEIIGLGAKERRGKIFDEWAFRFYVNKKRPLKDIPKDQQIPDCIFGIQTDVISHIEKASLICETSVLSVDVEGYRDEGIRGGISIRNEHFDNDQPSGYGTLGILARRKADNALVGLTCSHVVNAGSETPVTLGTKVGQPKYWISCCCCPHGYIGDVAKATSTNDLDCAIIDIHDDLLDEITSNGTENMVQGIVGNISGAAAVLCFETLRKRGRATGLTTGKVSDVAYGTNQMLIERTDGNPGDPFACYGDSGAVIVNSGNQVVGLLVAANRADMKKVIATHIKPVMIDLGITIAGTDAATVGEPVGGGAAGCELHAWPGGQADTALNPVEEFSSGDFQFTGPVDWDVSGGRPGAVIIETGTQTATNLERVHIRYDTVSSSKNPTDSVWVKAKSGANEATKFRTIFQFVARTVNTSSLIESSSNLRFAATGGTDNTQCGVAVPGTNGATWFMAKVETVYDIGPQDLGWSGSGGITFVTGAPAGIAGNIVARRETKFTKGEQASGAPNRTHTDQATFISAGDSTTDDFQGPTDAAPNELFRIANEGFDPTNLLQGYLRADYRDFLEFHNGTAWLRITPYGEWHADLTASLSGAGTAPPSVGAPNAIDVGAGTEKVPNEKPVVVVQDFQEVKPGELVTLSATSTSDPDNDVRSAPAWVQTAGTAVVLSSPTGNTVTFNAPANDPQLIFSATVKDSTEALSRTAGNFTSDPATVTVNVIDWRNIGGGDPVPGRNMLETFDAVDFGIGAGALNWDVTTGAVQAVIVEADGAAVAPTGTVVGATIIKVRYDNISADLTRAQTVKVQATHPGNGKVWFQRRTVFRVTVAVHATDTKTHLIPSTLGGTGKDHFCTAKGTGNMIFEAVLNPVPPPADIGWVAVGRAITVPSVGANRATAHIDRAPAAGVQVPIFVQVNGDDVYEGFAWIIWTAAPVVNLSPAPYATVNATFTQYTGTITFSYTIQPASITSATPATVDIPDLTGSNTNLLGVVVNPPDVPAGDVSVQNSGAGALSGGADSKWDVSRQNQQKPINLANVPDSVAFITGQGGADLMVLYTNFPSNALAGNDDRGTGDEDNDPYTAGTAGLGNIGSMDPPSRPLLHTDADVGDTFEMRLHFREFARVLLDNTWYPISDFSLWKIHMRALKASESDDGVDYDGDGARNKELWIDNGSVLEQNNNGF